ncbi:MAG: enoyl-CoA hydratase/isomerase family protein [Flavobacteriales bacterium]|nr:enoyl-CoA hydratase/isomerase family protein [Flavobacteriales bacterium]MDG1780912.1 enoyl-CoA hydratase/isomerase family protein [Flavobacteriales bacterium]MDG2245820.1 enoyl-CoA hydratase/isomerase family protein [Flavobacteriales bacterium]
MSTSEGFVKSSVANNVTTIEFYHPQSNSLPGHLLSELAQAITAAGTDTNSKVIVLKSSGDRAFCAGASFDELISINDEATGKRFFSGFANVINAARKCPKFIIGRVQGKAVGGGVGMASAVDYCMATKYAAVKLSELAIGIGPFVVGPAVERKVGTSAMSQLAINATEWKSAEWAAQKGLYTEVYEDVTALDEAVGTLAQKLATSNPEAMTALKENFWSGTEHWDELLKERAAMSGTLVLSDFTRNAIAAFKKK